MNTTGYIRHQDTWIERHIVASYIAVVACSSHLSLVVFENVYPGLLIGLIAANFILLRYMAKEVFFTVVNRVPRGGGGDE